MEFVNVAALGKYTVDNRRFTVFIYLFIRFSIHGVGMRNKIIFLGPLRMAIGVRYELMHM